MKVNQANDLYMKEQTIALPQALELVGNSNYYQWRTFLIMCLAVSTISFHCNSQSYIFIQPPLLCNGEPCSNYGDDFCKGQFTITVDRSDFKYDNVVTEFELWCQRKDLATIAQSMYFFGSIFGGSIMSYLGDKYGRRKIYISGWSIFTIGSIGLVNSVSIFQYMAMNAVMGFGGITIYILNYVILNEISGERFRQASSIGLLAAYSISEILTAFMFYIGPQWKIIYGAVVVIPAIVALALTYLIKETPQYYCTKKLVKDLIESLDTIAKINKRQKFSGLIPMIQDRLDMTLKQNKLPIKETMIPKAYTMVDLFRYKSLKNASIGFTIVSFTLHLVYYGGQYSISDISEGNTLYIIGAFMGLVELLSYVVVTLVIHKLPRKKSILISYILSISFCACFIFFGWSADSTKTDCDFCSKQIFVIAISSLVRIFNSFGFAIQALYANEIYPTCVRFLGTGLLFAIGIFGSFLSPYVIALGEATKINPYILIGGISICGPFATLLIRETLNMKKLDCIEEEPNIYEPSDSYDTVSV